MIDLEAIRARKAAISGDFTTESAYEEALELSLADIDALLAEVEMLRKECPNCHFQFLHQSGLDRHPCPPPDGYDFSAP